MKIIFVSALIAVFLSGCVTVSSPPGPRVSALPGTGQSHMKFAGDDQSCRDIATARVGNPSEIAQDQQVSGAVVGTILGALSGALFGAVLGGGRNIGAGAAIGAGAGLSTGAVAGTVAGQSAGDTAQDRWDSEYWTCMYAKGHKVPSSQPMIEQTPQPSMPSIPPPPAPK